MKSRFLIAIIAWMALLPTGLCAQTNNKLMLPDVEVKRGAVVPLAVKMENTDAIVAVQFTLHLPEGVSLNTSQTVKSSRLTTHTVSVREVEPRKYIFFIMSANNDAINGHSGELFTIDLNADRSLQTGSTLSMTISDAVLSLQSGENVLTEATAGQIIVGKAEKGKLSLQLSPSHVEENTGQQIRLTLTRTNGGVLEETFTLKATADSRISVPATITIPARQPAAVLFLTVTDNDVIDKNSVVEIIAEGEDYEAAKAQLVIEDNEFPALTVQSSKSTISEGETFQLTITTSEVVREPLTVTLTCENPRRFTCPMQATIPAGQKSVTVDVTAKDDDVPSETLSSAFIVSAPRYENGEVIVLLEDDDMPALELTILPNKVQEGAGPVSITGTLHRLTNTDKRVTVRLSDDSNGGLYFSQRELTLAKGVQQVNFHFGPVDNGKVDGDRQYTITAAVWLSSCSCSASGQAAGSVQAQLQVFDDDGPALTLTCSQATVREGVTTRLTVTRNTGTEQSLTVRLSSDHDDLLTYNHTLVIPAGQQSAYVEITPSANDTQNDSQTIVFTAESEGFSSGTCYVLVTDQTLPDATIAVLELADNEVEVGGTTTVSVTIRNKGVSTLPARTQTNLHMTGNRAILLPLYTLDPLDPGESVTLTKPLTLDAAPGQKSLYAVVNESCEVTELSYLNNSSSPVNVNILPPFKATVCTDKPYYLPGDTITLTGEVRGTDSANKEVEVYVINDGARQTLEATTDAQGKFVATYVTYSRQMGHFTTGACYPGENLSEAMAEFDVIGLYVNKSFTTCEVNKGDIFNGFINYSNPSNLTLSSVKVETVGSADNCEVSFQAPSTIKAGITGQIPFSLRGKEATEGVLWQKLPILITANDGVRVEHTLYYYVHSPKAQLYSETQTIHGSITVGTMREIPITITNRGKGETGIITIKTGADWITSASGLELPSMAYGDSATVVLQFSLPKDAPLNSSLKGTVALNCMSGDGLALDFDMLTVSSETGTLVVDVCDQYTYYSPDKPHLEGATVTVQHPVTQEVMGTGSTDKEGKCSFSLPAGQYRIVVSEPRHETLSYYVLVHPGIETLKEINLGLSGVSIEMVYEETEIEDEYELKTTITYETNVPVPVVEAILPDSLDIESLGENESLIFNAILTNKGLITALNTRLELPEPFDGITFTSLGEDMFDLAPQNTMVIPVKVTRGAYYANGSSQKRSVKIDFRCKTVVVPYYEEWCGKDHKIHKIPKEIRLRKCGPEIKIDPIDPLEGDGGPGDGPIIIIIPIDPVTPGFFSTNESDDCNPCLFNLKHALVNCGLSSLDVLFNLKVNNIEKLGIKLPKWAKDKINKLGGMDKLSDAVNTGNSLMECHSDDIKQPWKEKLDCWTAYIGILADVCTIAAAAAALPTEGTTLPVAGFCKLVDSATSVVSCLGDVLYGCLGGPISVIEGYEEVGDNISRPSFVDEAIKNMSIIRPYYDAQKEILHEIFGGDTFLNEEPYSVIDLLYAIAKTPEDQQIDPVAMCEFKPAGVTMTEYLSFISRINNTIEHYYGDDNSINKIERRDNSEEYNYIHYEKINEQIQVMYQVGSIAKEQGYQSVFDMLMATVNKLRDALNEPKNTICAQVTLNLEQRMTLTRQAVRGKLTVTNGHEEKPMKDVKLSFVVYDEYGNVTGTDKMQISPESLNGFVGESDFHSGWTLGAKETGSATIMFIPTKYAAPKSSRLYTFTGYISYVDPFSDLEITMELAPATLTVNPSPDLELTYLMQRDVYGDDPLTTDKVEPMEEAEFALIINNKGYGEAKNVRMLTEQPKITENEKGLFINFDIISSQVNGDSATLSLSQTIANDFGTIAARSQSYAQWWLRSTLLGHFTSYEVEANHVTSYGNQDLSLVDTVTIHEMVHGFTPKSSVKRGWLVNDIVDADDMPDVVYFTDATQQPLYMATGTTGRKSETEYQLTMTSKTAGWNYGYVADPTNGKQKLVKIVRQSDGAEMPVDNVWQTDRTLRDGRDWLYENCLHFVGDMGSGGETYILTFEPKPDVELAVEQFIGVPAESTVLKRPLEEVTVKFNKPVNSATFTADDLTLYCQGVKQDATAITISKQTDTDYRLGLGQLTRQDGYFVLTVQTANITDTEGFKGGEGRTAAWIQFLEPVQEEHYFYVTINKAGYATFYDSQWSYLLPSELKASVVSAAANDKLTYTTLDGNIVPKNTPVLLEATPRLAGTFTLTGMEGDAEYNGVNLLHGSDVATMATVGRGEQAYKLAYGPTGTRWSEVFGWYWGADGGGAFPMEAHKAWLVVPVTAAARGFSVEGDALDIDPAPIGEEQAESEKTIYDLQGRHVHSPLKKGVYISQGKKTVVR